MSVEDISSNNHLNHSRYCSRICTKEGTGTSICYHCRRAGERKIWYKVQYLLMVCAELVLFYCGAIHSFISIEFAKLLGARTESLKHVLDEYNPIRYNSICINYIPDVTIVLGGAEFTC